jgi:hypothetical protein
MAAVSHFFVRFRLILGVCLPVRRSRLTAFFCFLGAMRLPYRYNENLLRSNIQAKLLSVQGYSRVFAPD